MTVPAAPPPTKTVQFHKWHRAVLSLCFVAFAFELGVCLIVLPWLSNWDMSNIPVHSPALSDLWMSHYFRGLLTGLGFLNIYISLVEFTRLTRHWLSRRRKLPN